VAALSSSETRGVGARKRRSNPGGSGGVGAKREGAPVRTVPRPGARVAGTLRVAGSQVSGVQRVRMLRAATEVVGELGYGGMSVARITARAGVSRRTFYDLFEDREDCFLAVFEEAVARAAALAHDAGAREESWRGRVRAGLRALLACFDREPLVGSLLVVDALGAGARVLERRARVLDALIAIVDAGRAEAPAGAELPPLTAEGVVGAVLAVVHARMLERRRRPLLEMSNHLMGMIVLPYLGPSALAQELARPVPRMPRKPAGAPEDPLNGLDMRLTYRTLRVLAAIAAHPGVSNRMVAEAAGVQDQGQISKLLTRLENIGLIANSGQGQAKGEPNAWKLTRKGLEVEHSVKAEPETPG
jgi:AcrR family transcriptional regulator